MISIQTDFWIPEKSDGKKEFFSKHQKKKKIGGQGILNGSVGNSHPTFVLA
jgi:hypothetical protein